jgi:hypothetical protein
VQILFFALRNFNRARTRTWITVGAMGFACAIMIFYASLLEGWLAGMEKNAVGMDLGEFQMPQVFAPILTSISGLPGKSRC